MRKLRDLEPSARINLVLGVGVVLLVLTIALLVRCIAGSAVNAVQLVLVVLSLWGSGLLLRELISDLRAQDDDEHDADNESDESAPEVDAAPRAAWLARVGTWLAAIAGMLVLCADRLIPGSALLGVVLVLTPWLLRTASGSGHLLPEGSPGYRTSWLAENALGLLTPAIIIILSYIFLIEAFRIPTGSMEPTLHGDFASGERVLVNKPVMDFGEPRLGDIAVLRFPLLRSAPYVKRLAAEPESLIVISRGDVVTQLPGKPPEVWRKQGREREAMWLPYEPFFTGGSESYRTNFEALSGSGESQGDAIKLAAAGGKPGAIRFPRSGHIVDHNAVGATAPEHMALYGHEVVGDVRLRLTLKRKDKADFALTHLRGDSRVKLYISGDKAELSVSADFYKGVSQSKDFTFPNDGDESEATLEFAVCDGEAWVLVNGEEAARLEVPLLTLAFLRQQQESKLSLDPRQRGDVARLERALPHRTESRLLFETRGEVELASMQLWRDIHYLGRRVWHKSDKVKPVNYEIRAEPTLPYAWKLGKDEWFALGDNSENSLDSRAWHSVTFVLKDGREFTTADKNDFAGTRGALRLMRDDPSSLDMLARVQNACLRAPDGEELAVVEEALLSRLRGGKLGDPIIITDIYARERSFKPIEVEAVRIEHTPGVPRSLIDGTVLGSVWPLPPRLVY